MHEAVTNFSINCQINSVVILQEFCNSIQWMSWENFRFSTELIMQQERKSLKTDYNEEYHS